MNDPEMRERARINARVTALILVGAQFSPAAIPYAVTSWQHGG